MIKSKTFIIGLIILVVVTISGSYILLTWQPPAPYIPSSNKKEAGLPKATGNVDDLVEASIRAILDENSLYTEEDNDVSLGLTDNKEINDFGQTVNENEF